MRSVILISLYFLFSVYALAADDFTIYRPKYRPAEELVSLARNMFGQRAALSSLNDKIVISAPKGTTAAVLKLFAEVDREPRRYRISLRLVTARDSESDHMGAEIRGRNVRIHLDDRREVAAGQSLQVVDVLDGREALLSIGTMEQPGGFFVKPTGGGAGVVTLSLHQKEPGANPSLSLSSEVSLPLGKWRSVGSVSQTTSGRQSKILGRSAQQGNSHKDVQLRVEEVRPTRSAVKQKR